MEHLDQLFANEEEINLIMEIVYKFSIASTLGLRQTNEKSIRIKKQGTMHLSSNGIRNLKKHTFLCAWAIKL